MGSSDLENWICEAKDSTIGFFNDHVEQPVCLTWLSFSSAFSLVLGCYGAFNLFLLPCKIKKVRSVSIIYVELVQTTVKNIFYSKYEDLFL